MHRQIRTRTLRRRGAPALALSKGPEMMGFCRAILIFTGLVFAMGVGSVSGQTIRISEAMSSNGDVLLDQNGDSSDWIELHNTTESAVSLNGWFLTDDEGDLSQWQFPDVELPAKGYLIVFASDKDRSAVGAELHTNFKLSASGDYVALVRPDGVTVEDSVTLPELFEDVAFGYGYPTVSSDVLFDQGIACTALVPTAEVPGWQEKGFDDQAWLSGVTGVGFEAASNPTVDYGPLIGLDIEDSRRTNATVYIRVPFTAANASLINGLTLRMKYEDAFVAYLNGVEVARSEHVPDELTYNSRAARSHSDSDAIEFEDYDISAFVWALTAGENVLAIHGLNQSTSSNDVLFLPRMEGLIAGDLEPSVTGQLKAPTPGGANTAIEFAGGVEVPVVMPERGFYDSPIEAEIFNPTPGAVARYTTDGSEPTEDSPEFSSSLTISETTTLRVRSFVPTFRPSEVLTHTYLFVADVVQEARASRTFNGQLLITGLSSAVLAETYLDASGDVVSVEDALRALPALSITTDEANLFDRDIGIYVNATESWERPASAEWIHADGSEGFQINGGLRIRGGFSRTPDFAKHSFRFFFRDEYGKDRLDYDFFDDGGITSYKKLDLRTTQAGSWAKNNNIHNTFLRDICFRDSQLAMGDVSTRSAWCHIYLNGSYWGMYMTEERPEENFGADYFGGDKDDYDLVKIWRPYDNQPPGSGFWIESPPPAGNLDAYGRLHQAMLNGFNDNEAYFAVQGMNAQGERDPAHERLVDVENMINFLLGIYYAAAVDNGITWWTGSDNILNNLYGLYNRENPDGFKWIQHDGEISYDRVARRYPDDLDRTGPFTNSQLQEFGYFNPQTLHDALVSNAEYRLKVADQVQKHLTGNGALVRENSEARLDYRAAQIDRAIVAQSARWGSTTLDRDAWVTAVEGQRGFLGRSEDRCNEVIAYLAADGLIPSVFPPTLGEEVGEVESGAMVSLSASEGIIYFTTDGSDPREVGGAVAGLIYDTPLVISQPTQIKARVLHEGEWSALTEASYWNPEVPLAITEIMYHAAGGSAHDFIEIQNLSSEPVSLSGYSLSNAVSLDLGGRGLIVEPGGFVVMADDEAALRAAYPGQAFVVAGGYSGGLSNSGERLDLSFNGNVLISLRYNDARNWPQAADGGGHSLVAAAPAIFDQESGSLDYGGNWRASAVFGGSPGAGDPWSSQTVLLNEIVAHTATGMAAPFDSNDQIELYNPTGSEISLNGWFLTDDPEVLQKWSIPQGTAVPAGGYVLFDESDFHPGRTGGFGLDKAGEEVLLVSPAGVVDAIAFKGQSLGGSYGRYPDGAESWGNTVPTPGASNLRAENTVQISELMYRPLPPAGEELAYIQLKNISANPVELFSSTGAFRIDGGVSFTFPPGLSLAAGRRLWILSFDPSDTVQLNAFASAYGLNTASELFHGPYDGMLSDRGERVSLESPQNPDAPAEVSWVVVDELFYFNQAPWPTLADGTGMPLVRTGATTWGVTTPGDSDADGIEDSWEQANFGNLDQSGGDWDGDGWSDRDEFIADTDPKDRASHLTVAISGKTLSWESRPGRVYSITWTSDLSQPFAPLVSGLTAGAYTDAHSNDDGLGFYRLEVRLE